MCTFNQVPSNCSGFIFLAPEMYPRQVSAAKNMKPEQLEMYVLSLAASCGAELGEIWCHVLLRGDRWKIVNSLPAVRFFLISLGACKVGRRLVVESGVVEGGQHIITQDRCVRLAPLSSSKT